MISPATTPIGDCPGLKPLKTGLAAALLAAGLALSACASGGDGGPSPSRTSPSYGADTPRSALRPAPQTPRPAAPPVIAPSGPSIADLLRFGDVEGWAQLDPAPALSAFVLSCERLNARPDQDWLNPRTPFAGRVGDWRDVCVEAALLSSMGAQTQTARDFFERNFTPVQVNSTGKLTGYYEPILEVRHQPDMEFSMAIRAKPGDLLSGDLGQFIAGLEGQRIVGRANNQTFEPYRTRAEIEAQNLGIPLAWGRPIDVFFLQIQGSGRLVYPDGGEARVRFSAHNGLQYVSIGRILIERGELDPHNASKQDIEAWLRARGPLSWRPLFDENPRYVFFSMQSDIDHDVGPIGSQGASLTPMASLAVDPAYHAWGVPIVVNAALHGEPGWSGLVIAQDAGGAITGPARGDLFFGWGYEAGERAGRQNDDHARWTLLLPNALAGQAR